jgi:hypothetical protein
VEVLAEVQHQVVVLVVVEDKMELLQQQIQAVVEVVLEKIQVHLQLVVQVVQE